MNRTNEVSRTGIDARNLLLLGLEVNSEIAREEPELPKGLDEAVLMMMIEHGPVALLEALHDAAWGAAEMNEEDDEITCLRLRVFGKRLGAALEALK